MTKEIYFAAGCFWGTEKLFSSIRGVLETQCGYANGNPDINPDYQRVCQGDTGYRETVYVRYDSQQVSLSQLLTAFFLIADPTVTNRQGNDIGTQYQCGIYYSDPEDRGCIVQRCLQEAEGYDRFTVEQLPLSVFVPAEQYHQKYLDKNPGGYCHVNPRLFGTIDSLIR